MVARLQEGRRSFKIKSMFLVQSAYAAAGQNLSLGKGAVWFPGVRADIFSPISPTLCPQNGQGREIVNLLILSSPKQR